MGLQLVDLSLQLVDQLLMILCQIRLSVVDQYELYVKLSEVELGLQSVGQSVGRTR